MTKPSPATPDSTRSPQQTSPRPSAFVALIRTADRVMGEYAALFRSHGISDPQYNVLRILRGAGAGGLPCQEIRKRMIARVPDITRLLDRLEVSELVLRERDERDRRIVLTRISSRGRSLLRRLDRPVEDVSARQFSGLNDAQLRQLTTLLATIEANARS